jgi:hypothetical protein
MRKEGYRESTCRFAVQVLKGVARHVPLLNPNEVKGFLAKASCGESRKQRTSWDLVRFYKWRGIPFEMSRYRQIEKLPFILLEAEIEQLIGGMGKKTATRCKRSRTETSP